ncbi:MAG TPA: Ppx/GppA family phosphatase [Magnetospirillaceae bacterium]|nr:Ppx/GppA family phosphatase [Magnetospirillaceae bacterium]
MKSQSVPSPRSQQKNIAIVDIGSNSIRLVVYDGRTRAPVPLFNEKAVCGLGQGMHQSGRLNPDGVTEALQMVGRFVRLARAMDVGILDVLATAAVRDASDGPAFVKAIEESCDIDVTVLAGDEEARLAAMGVLCSTPNADGAVADLGGGSLELVALDHGRFAGLSTTFPLGVLRLSDASNGQRAAAEVLIDKHFSTLSWWTRTHQRPLYAVGGAWRALARLCIAQTGHPLHVLDNFTLAADEAIDLAELISRQSFRSLDKVPGLSKKRQQHLPLAALLLGKVLQYARPSRLVFSVYGMREGRFYQHLNAESRNWDPLLAACADMARTAGRFPEHGQEIMDWMAPLLPFETAHQRRLREAACLLGDVFWNEHPDYRAEQAFLRVFRLPFMGLGHKDRALLALAIHARYGGDDSLPQAADARSLLSEEEQKRASLIGMALRLGHGLSGGVPGLLPTTKLSIDAKQVVLSLPKEDPAFAPDLIDRRYDRLAKLAGYDSLEMKRK